MPLEVIYGKEQTSNIWEALSGVIDQISNTFKKSQQSKWEKQVMSSYISDIENAKDKKGVDLDIFNLTNPPSEIINPPGLEKFAKDTAGLLQQKKLEMGILPQGEQKPVIQPQTTGQVIPQEEQAKPLISQPDFQVIFNAIQNIPTGEIDFTNTFNLIKSKLDKSWSMTELVQSVLGNIGQANQPVDQRAKFESDLLLSKKVQDILYPESEGTQMPKSEMELYLTNPELYGQYKEAGRVPKEPETQLDIEALNTFMKDNNLKVKGVTVNEKGERNISLEPIEGGESSLSDMLILIKKLEEEGFNASYTKNGLSVGVPEPKTTAEEKVTTTEVNFVDEKFKEVKTNAQYDEALNKVRLVDKIIPVPSKEKIFKGNYDEAMSYIKSLIDNNGKILEGNPGNSKYSYEQIYAQAYDDLVEAIQEYKIATGVTFYNPYISLDEYNKSDKTKWYNPTTWTSQPSVNQ